MRWIGGIDGGGSKTAVLLRTVDGKETRTCRVGSIDPAEYGVGGYAAGLLAALTQLGVTAERGAAVCIGIPCFGEYPELDAARPERMDAALSEARAALLADLGGRAPDPGCLDSYKLKYDYHNAKAVLKAAAVGTDPARMFMDMGRIPASELKSAMERSELDTLPGLLPEAVAEAKNVLDTTRDPQLSDITLDGWM